jgi:AcrR family transcriptional regulator
VTTRRSAPDRSGPRAISRRRGARLEDALLEAAWAELLAVGYRNLTMEGIARRAGTSKPVIYRRWSSRVEVVIAALRRHTGSLIDRVPDTGSLREDTLAVLRHMTMRFSEIPAHARHGLIAEAWAEAGVLGGTRATEVMPRIMSVILNRAAQRGEIPRADLPPRILKLPADLVRHEMMIADAPAPEGALVEIVDEIFLPLVTRPDGPRAGGRASNPSRQRRRSPSPGRQ